MLSVAMIFAKTIFEYDRCINCKLQELSEDNKVHLTGA